MKIKITFKDPDAVSDAIDQAFDLQQKPDGIDDDEWGDIIQSRKESLSLKPWVEWMEYVTIEIDTDAKTCVVVPLETP